MPASKSTKKTSKTVRKSPARKKPVKKEVATKDSFQNVRATFGKSRTAAYLARAKNVKKNYYIIGIIIIIVALALYFGWSYLFVAQVNGQLIPRYKVTSELEDFYGSVALNQQIDEMLIKQDAKKKGVSVSDAEVNSQIEDAKTKLSQSGMTLDQYLKGKGLTLSKVKEQLRMNLLQNKLIGDTSVSDKEINQYIQQNGITVPEDASSAAQLKDSVKNQLQQNKFQTKYQDYVTNLRQKANIKLFVNYPPPQQAGY